jgi:DNA-binding NtrC family response regulator/tetratricopeptide (TPR) repeat protein
VGYADPASRNWDSGQFQEAVALFHKGDNAEAISIIRGMIPKHEKKELEHFELLRLMSLCSHTSGELSDAEATAVQISENADSLGRSNWTGHALLLLAAVNRDRGHIGYASDLASRAKDLLREVNDLPGLSRACYELGYGLLLQGRLAEASAELEAATALSRVTADVMTEALASRRLAFCYVQQNEFAPARVAYERALRLFTELGSDWRCAQAVYGLVVLEICLGDLREARRLVDGWNNYYRESSNPIRLARWRLLNAWLDICSGRAPNAIQDLTLARTEFVRMGAQRDVALACEYLGDALGLTGDDAGALAAYVEATEWGRRISVAADVVLESLRKTGEAYSRLGDYASALGAMRKALSLSKIYTEPLERAALMRLRGIVKLKRNRAKAGIEFLESSWSMFFRIGALLEAASTASVLAHYYSECGSGPEASVWQRRVGSEEPAGTQLLLRRSNTASIPGKRDSKAQLRELAALDKIITQDSRVLRSVGIALKAAPLDLPVLILGETGTGKELFATLAHNKSGRKGSLLAINCAAIPADILDAELFGHAKGAYTGAHQDRPGLIEAASGGTLFLDEIGEMTLAVQGRLLRAIEAREIRRLGENHSRKVGTRFVGATHRDLGQMVKDGKFRADLFFRLQGIIVNLPPLRERPNDILLLADHFLSQAATRMGREFELTRDARKKLLTHSWPGNVRELRSVIERAAAMCEEGRPIADEDLGVQWVPVPDSLAEHMEAEERRNLLATLESADWNQAKAARQLKIKRTTLVSKLRRLGIDRPTRK